MSLHRHAFNACEVGRYAFVAFAMRLVRFRHNGSPVLAVERGDVVELCDGPTLDPRPTGVVVAKPADDALLPPIIPADILCIGLNYREHAAETNSTPPEHPMLFIKSGNTLAGPADVVTLPHNSDQVDFEAELAVVIGRDAKDVRADDVLSYVYGYTCANDVSARDWQKDNRLNGGQFARGKSFDGFCPLGPTLVTADEVPDPQNLRVTLELNGTVMQDSTTADMIFPVAEIVASLSRTMTVRAGSVILTGTPAGVGVARTPPVFLKDGDVTRVTVESVSTLVTRFSRRPLKDG